MKNNNYHLRLKSGERRKIEILDAPVFKCYSPEGEEYHLSLEQIKICEYKRDDLDVGGKTLVDTETGDLYYDVGHMFSVMERYGNPVHMLSMDDNKSDKRTMVKSYLVEMISGPGGVEKFFRTNDGFNAFELLGVLQHAQREILDQINGISAPDVIQRTVVDNTKKEDNE